jgi:putative RNA 2'-phosphotransferase
VSAESTSRFLSYVLRHNPGELDLELDRGGWVDVEELVRKANEHGRGLSREQIERAMRASDKSRFTIREGRIRANYGHSVDVDLEVEPAEPPETLYHGTARRNLDAIREEGLTPQSRQYVHLSTAPDDARQVGSRHGTPVVLRVRAAALHQSGHPFYRTAADVWLTPHVPPEALET